MCLYGIWSGWGGAFNFTIPLNSVYISPTNISAAVCPSLVCLCAGVSGKGGAKGRWLRREGEEEEPYVPSNHFDGERERVNLSTVYMSLPPNGVCFIEGDR